MWIKKCKMRPINSNRNWHKHNLRPSDFNNRQHFSRSKIETKKKKKKKQRTSRSVISIPSTHRMAADNGLIHAFEKGGQSIFYSYSNYSLIKNTPERCQIKRLAIYTRRGDLTFPQLMYSTAVSLKKK